MSTSSGEEEEQPENLLRQAGLLERFHIVRSVIGFYNSVVVSASYSSPHAQPLTAPLLVRALQATIAEQPVLSAGILVSEDLKESPAFVRLPRIDFSRAGFIRWEQSSSAAAHDRELAALVCQLNNTPFANEELALHPAWRVAVLQRSYNTPTAHDSATNAAGRAEYDILFCFHHAIADGLSGAAFHYSLLKALNGTLASPAAASTPATATATTTAADTTPAATAASTATTATTATPAATPAVDTATTTTAATPAADAVTTTAATTAATTADIITAPATTGTDTITAPTTTAATIAPATTTPNPDAYEPPADLKLLPPMEEVLDLGLGFKTAGRVAAHLGKGIIPSFLRKHHYTGAVVGASITPSVVRVLRTDATQILKSVKARGVSITAFLAYAGGDALYTAMQAIDPATYAAKVKGKTLRVSIPVSYRRHAGFSNEVMTDCIGAIEWDIPRADGGVGGETAALKKLTKGLREAAGVTRDSEVGLLALVGDMEVYFKEQVGKERGLTFEVSNLGVWDAAKVGGAQKGGDGWKIEEAVFSQGSSVAGPAFTLNVATVGERMTVAVQWMQGAIGDPVMEELVRQLEKGLDDCAKWK